jgi:hypothetical protein
MVEVVPESIDEWWVGTLVLIIFPDYSALTYGLFLYLDENIKY